MHDMKVECPECGAKVSVDASLRKHAQEEAEREIKKVKKQLLDKEKELHEQAERLKLNEEDFQDKLKKEVFKQAEQLKKQAEQEASKKLELELRDLKEQLKEKSNSLTESHKEQLELRKKMREVEEKEKEIELQIMKQVEEASKKAEEEAMKLATDKFRFELSQKEKVIQQMREKTDELQNKLLQSSQQAAGEIVEEEFEKDLRLKFPLDVFEEVPKGIDGADLIQRVRSDGVKDCGTILLEFKNQKNFSSTWVQKLNEDQRRVGANIAVLVTKVMPKGSADIEMIDGVYVVPYHLAIPFISTLRKSLEDLSRAQVVATNKDTKMAMIYDYLTGDSFKQKFKSIVGSYREQKELLDQERRAMTRIWAKREKQLGIVIEAATSMYGDVEGIIGSSAPVIEELALLEPSSDELAEDYL